MQTMTLDEYLKYALVKAIAQMAEKDGVAIVTEKPARPRLEVVMLRPERNEAANTGDAA
jgi:hypothetical protein